MSLVFVFIMVLALLLFNLLCVCLPIFYALLPYSCSCYSLMMLVDLSNGTTNQYFSIYEACFFDDLASPSLFESRWLKTRCFHNLICGWLFYHSAVSILLLIRLLFISYLCVQFVGYLCVLNILSMPTPSRVFSLFFSPTNAVTILFYLSLSFGFSSKPPSMWMDPASLHLICSGWGSCVALFHT